MNPEPTSEFQVSPHLENNEHLEHARKIRRIPKKRKRDFIYHLRTKNMSFLETHRDLRLLGIENNMFFLILYDESLEYVDPFDPNLDPETIQKVIMECVRNPWYFLRECVVIPEQGGSGMPYMLHRGNLAATFCYLNGLDHYLAIPRQKGKTQSTVAALNWSFLFGTNNSEFMFINKTQDDANNNLDRLKQQRELLPPYMRFEQIHDPDSGKIIKGTDNVKSLVNPVTKNKIITKPMATSKERADNIGRGTSQPIQYYDEVDFTPFIKTIVEAAGPAFNTARKNARRNGASYCRIFTSTPGDLDSQAGMDAFEIIQGTCKWTEQFYDWPIDKIQEYIKTNSRNQILYIEYSYKQLGDDETWLQEISQTLLNNPVKIKREVYLQRMRGSSLSPFEPEELEAIQSLQGKVDTEIFINNFFKLDIYKAFDRKRHYIVGVDISHGLGSDNTAVVVLDPYSLEPVADFRSPYISPVDTANFLITLVSKYIPRAILAVERNNVGTTVIELLRQSTVSNRVYYDSSQKKEIDVRTDSLGFLKNESANRRLFGVWTGVQSRDIMMSILEERVKLHKDKFISINLVNDLMTLVRKKNNKIEHGVGFHDDTLMAYLIAMYVYHHGSNLHRYGLVKGLDPDAPKNAGLQEDPAEMLSLMPEEIQEQFSNVSFVDPAELVKKAQLEYEQARREAQQIDMALKPINYVTNEMYDDEDVTPFTENFFDELNY